MMYLKFLLIKIFIFNKKNFQNMTYAYKKVKRIY